LTNLVSGADSAVGTVVLDSAAPLKGVASARIANTANTNAYLEETFTGADDLYVALYLRFSALPTSNVQIVAISNNGTSVGNLLLLTNGKLRLRNNATAVGKDTSPLTPGTIYRVGIHQKKSTLTGGGGNGNAILEAYVATGDAAFGTYFARMTNGTWTTQADRLWIGATNLAALNATFDDIRLDSASMPGASTLAASAAAAETGVSSTSEFVAPVRYSSMICTEPVLASVHTSEFVALDRYSYRG